MAHDDEITRFLRPTASGSTRIDPLDWWKKYEEKFLTLYKVARDLLSIHASSVTLENTFYQAGRVVNDYRTRLGDETIQVCVLFKSWTEM